MSGDGNPSVAGIHHAFVSHDQTGRLGWSEDLQRTEHFRSDISLRFGPLLSWRVACLL